MIVVLYIGHIGLQMKDITESKNRYSRIFSERCEHNMGRSDINACTRENGCRCRFEAEIRAYLDTILPKGFQKFNVFNFDGKKEEEVLLEPEKLIEIKEQISKYCWDVPYYELADMVAKKSSYREKKYALGRLSCMDSRRENGDCVAIFGEEKGVGRTLVASIILHEAIGRRFYSNNNALQTYDWIEFSSLKHFSINDKEKLNDYQHCDWLVVDNILKSDFVAEPHVRNFITSVIDPFFISRNEESKPTILVFRFDPEGVGVGLQDIFGIGIDKILTDKNTVHIGLT